MKFLQYNILSLGKKGIKELIELYMEKNNIECAVLNEIWLKDNRSTNLLNFIGNFRNDGYGGVDIYLRKNIRFMINKIDTDGEVISISTLNLPYNVNINGIYCPPDVNVNHFGDIVEKSMAFFEDSSLTTFVCGDFNAKSSSWGNMNTDRRGASLDNLIRNYGYTVLNDGSKTFVGPSGESAIHLTLVRSNNSSIQ
ncbi:putative RNA-directed DNA polymerase from transposon X-element [Lucilia cuprina]|nr:putative RNA-directed DNA polymerase from transposon X-element [Lucilia cuprina]